MTDWFFDRPILSSPCARPSRHWKLNENLHHYAQMDVINEFRRQQPKHGQR